MSPCLQNFQTHLGHVHEQERWVFSGGQGFPVRGLPRAESPASPPCSMGLKALLWPGLWKGPTYAFGAPSFPVLLSALSLPFICSVL